MMQEHRTRPPAQQTGQKKLPPGRAEQVRAADHQIHTMVQVVDRHGELIGPISQPVS